jgi:hypothetical protein
VKEAHQTGTLQHALTQPECSVLLKAFANRVAKMFLVNSRVKIGNIVRV